jgi:hypothetical protein
MTAQKDQKQEEALPRKLNTNVAASRLHGRHTKQINLPHGRGQRADMPRFETRGRWKLPTVLPPYQTLAMTVRCCASTPWEMCESAMCDVLSGVNAYTSTTD